MRTLAIGDIHGCLTSLDELLDFVTPTPDDIIVALGDYVDRGPDSKGVIDRLLDLRESHQLVTLRGNHEVMMQEARQDDTHFAFSWPHVGGDLTMASFGVESPQGIPQLYWDFLDSLLPWYETDTHFFVHANADPDLALSDQPDTSLYWEKFNNPPPHQSGKTMVCGHTSQESGYPISVGHAVCIDTRVYDTGWLTCLDVESGTVWQAHHSGQRRMDALSAFENQG